MAIDNRLQIFDENGNPVDYDIMATDVKFADGKDLPTKLDELEDEIGESQDGYTPPPGGIPKTDLAPAVQQTLDDVAGKVDKVTGKGLSSNDYTDTDKAKVDNLKPVATSGSYNDLNDKPTIPTVPTMDATPTAGNTTHMVSSDGVAAAIAAALAQAGGQVTVTTNGDGTFTIHSGDNDYTINLNHTHENMAKIVKVTEATLPQELDDDTIYVQVDTNDTEIEKLYLFGHEFTGGGGVSPSAPRITSPANGSTIDVGSIAEGESSVSGSVNVQARNLTQPLTVAITSGTGFSLSYGQQSGASVSIPAADAMAVFGANVTIVCTNTATNAAGGLSIGSTELSTIDVSLIANKPSYTDIAGVKLTGTQYLRLNYKTNPNTKIEIDMQFEQRSGGQTTGYVWIGTYQNHNGIFYANFGTASDQNSTIFYWLGDDGYIEGGSSWSENYVNQGGTISYIQNPSKFVYTNGNVSFQGVNTAVQTKTISQDGDLLIGAQLGTSQSSTLSIFNRYNLKIFSIKISENGTTLLNLVPKLESGTIPCLYDTVNDVVYKSETSTPLEAITQNS